MSLNSSQTKHTLLMSGQSAQQKRRELMAYFKSTCELYQSLFDCIASTEGYYLRAEPLRHPLIFYYGHTATFYINKLILGQYIEERINPQFEAMFAVGVDEMSWDDLDSKHYDWPTVQEVSNYRCQVHALIETLIDSMPLVLPIEENSLAWLLMMGIEHERIHLETSSVIMRMLPLHLLNPSSQWSSCKQVDTAPNNQLLSVKGGSVRLGRGQDKAIYGWDNEFGEKLVNVSEFKASQFLTSNQEYLAFIEAGGYQNVTWWTEEGRQWLAFSKAEMPRFWKRIDGQYWQRNLLEEIKLPLNWPVEVNCLEAQAFCNWKSECENPLIRLPTEAEWMLLRGKITDDSFEWGATPGNINLEYSASSCPVDLFAQGDFYDVIGNVWQWTETAIDAYPGFNVHKLYDDFSTPTFDGKHNLIKGGSWISTGNLATKKARYAFRRHFFQHAGFRYVQSHLARNTVEPMNTYETDIMVSQYLEFHYGQNYFHVPNFPVACIDWLMSHYDGQERSRALDLGCSVGRSSFELAKFFEKVDGIDFSARFIQQAVHLQESGMIRYAIATEGELIEYKEITLSQLGYENLNNKIHFTQGDACNLKPIFKDYNLIFCGNLIDRLYDPTLFLKTISERLSSGGYLVLTSPYTWLEEYTNKNNWLGGVRVNGEAQDTLTGLKTLLAAQFELIAVGDIPFVIRETQRKFQHSIAQISVWALKF